jgi:hypothetical protein
MPPALGGPNDEERRKDTLARSSWGHAYGVGHRPPDSVVHCHGEQAGTVSSASTIIRLLLKRPHFPFKISCVCIIQTEPLPKRRCWVRFRLPRRPGLTATSCRAGRSPSRLRINSAAPLQKTSREMFRVFSFLYSALPLLIFFLRYFLTSLLRIFCLLNRWP